MEPVISLALTKALDAFLGAIGGQVSDDLMAKLRGDPAQKAFKQALGNAIQRYAIGDRFALARPLLQPDSLLSQPTIASELVQLVQFDREPNYELIGQRWRAALDQPPQWRNFTAETLVLLGYLENELRNTEVFRSVFEQKRLDAIAENAAVAADVLSNIERQLQSLYALMDSHFVALAQAAAVAPGSIRDQIRDTTGLIEEKTRDFVGRHFVFDAIQKFVDDNPRGYFFIRGDPGIGKSALSAKLVRDHGYIHHFNVRAEGINKTDNFLRNICAQLIAVYELNHAFLPPEVTQDAGFLNKLLEEVSEKIGSQGKCVLVIDALDEVDRTGSPPGANILYLPSLLPRGIYIIATTRRDQLPLRIDVEQQTLDIEQDSQGNIADVREYVEGQVKNPGLQRYTSNQQIDEQAFITYIVDKSQGNFIYLRLVLPEIERGAYTDRELTKIPIGLTNYYEDHWQRIRRASELDWFEYKLPVVIALTIVKEPVSIDLLSDFSYIDEKPKIRAVIQDFEQFIFKVDVDHDGDKQRRYRWYHASFFDFIAAKEDIADERVSLIKGHQKAADKMWKDLFEN